MVEEISCCGYRGFATNQTLKLAIPNGEKGSGLTVLIGPNGGGKSTIMECFSKIATTRVSFTKGKRNKVAGDMVCIEIKYDNQSGKLASVMSGGSETTWNGPKDRPKIYYLPSRRVFNPYFIGGSMDRVNYIKNLDDPQFRGGSLDEFSNRLFETNNNPTVFNEMFWKILGKELHWTIDQEDTGQYYVKVAKSDDISHNSDGLGEGIVSLLFITDALAGAKQDELIVIDEPELSLHPQLQMRLLNELLEITRTIQVVIATHSANMISIEAAINGGQIARVYEKNKSSVIACIDDDCREHFKSFDKNVCFPHTFGTDARSCFFAEDGYIITEGQEDVVLLPKILDQLGLPNDIALFGFGAGGVDNIPYMAYILKCLGFSHIGALFDGDKQKEYDNFIEKFKDVGYKAWILPANDVRDKRASHIKHKKGLLKVEKNQDKKTDNHKYQLKAKYKKDKGLKKILNEMIEFSKYHV